MRACAGAMSRFGWAVVALVVVGVLHGIGVDAQCDLTGNWTSTLVANATSDVVHIEITQFPNGSIVVLATPWGGVFWLSVCAHRHSFIYLDLIWENYRYHSDCPPTCSSFLFL